MSDDDRWRSYVDEPPFMNRDVLIELHRPYPPATWDRPSIMRFGDIPQWLNVNGLYWRVPT